MTTFYLVRHAVHASLDCLLASRLLNVRLSEAGRAQAGRVAEWLGTRITAIQSSPRERALETAGPIAAQAGLEVEIAAPLDEIDLGDWSGRAFAELDEDAGWRRWNSARSSSRPPKGESMRELQLRVMSHIDCLHLASPQGQIALVSHAEPIRAAVLNWLDLPLDDFARIEIAPAAVTTAVVDEGRARILGLNQVVAP